MKRFLLLFLLASVLNAADTATVAVTRDSVSYGAETIHYSRAESLLTLTGKARLEQAGMTLTADTILFYTGRRSLTAMGKPVLNDNGNVMAGEHMVYLLNEKKGRIDYGSAHAQGDIYNGEAIARMADESFLVRNGDFSTCDIDSAPHYFFFGEKMKVVPRDKIIAKPVVMNIGDVPVAILPFFIFPIKHGRQSGLLMPRIGQFTDNGSPAFYVHNVGYYFALSDYMDLETKLDFQNGDGFFFQSIYLNGDFNYSRRYWLNGHVGGRMDLSRSDESSSRNWELNYNHSQELLPDGSFRVSGAGALVGNGNYYRQSSLNRTDFLKRELRSNMGISKNWRDLGLNTNMNFDYRENLDTREKTLNLPSFSFSSANRSFYTRERELGVSVPPESLSWYERMTWGYGLNGINTRASRLEDRKSQLDTRIDTTRHLQYSSGADMHHNLSFGLSPAPKIGPINIFPSFGMASDFYFKERTQGPLLRIDADTLYGQISYDTLYAYDTLPGFNHREYYNMGVNLNTQLYGVSIFHLGRLAGFRHILSPSIGYNFSPELKSSETYITAGTTSNGKQDEQQNVTLGADNTFQVKLAADSGDSRSTEQTVTLTNLSVRTGYNFMARNPEGRAVGRWGDIATHAGTNLGNLSLSYDGTHTLYDLTTDRFLPLQAGPFSARFPKLLRYNLSAATGASLAGKFSNGEWAARPLNEAPQPSPMNPWSLNFDFRYNYSSLYNARFRVFESSSSFSLNDNLTFLFSDNWRLSYHSRYDFQQNELVEQGMNLVRDFHCWDATFDWIISGYNPGYYFRVAIKEIPDVKFEKRGGQYGSFYGGGMSFPGQGLFGQ
ncbi:MAG: putative LPS assembly protein LptD [Fibrobacterota bacterium]